MDDKIYKKQATDNATENLNAGKDADARRAFVIKDAAFLTSVTDAAKILDTKKPEIAIAGKSNVGKSSLINFIVNRRKLAYTSQTPGLTRMLNYYQINGGEFYIVDLPGYGFAKISKSQKAEWGNLVEGYLQKSRSLVHAFVLLDIRHQPTEDDLLLLKYLQNGNIDFTIIATKCDKLSRQQILKQRQNIASAIKIGADNIILSSSQDKRGREEILARIAQILS
jgi:GTP-binding protein